MNRPNPRKSPESWFAAVSTPHFPAQTLAAKNRFLRKKPFVVIEQGEGNHKTPVVAVSHTARELGIEAGYSAFLVSRKWPCAIVLARDLAEEACLRSAMEKTLLVYTPVLSVRNNGDSLLDMTGSPFSRKDVPQIWGLAIQKSLRDLGLEGVSLGIASSQAVARVVARLNQPDGMQVCPAGDEMALLDPLPPEWLPGISPHVRQLFHKYGLASVKNLRRLGKEELQLRFGQEAEKLYCLTRGLDLEATAPKHKPLYAETVLSRDLNDEESLRNQVRLTTDKLVHVLRLNQSRASQLTLTLTYSDKRSTRRTVKLQPATAAFLVLSEKTVHLFAELYQRRVALRRIQLIVSLPQTETGQIDLFDEARIQKQEALAQAIDRIRRKRSFNDLLSGSNVTGENLRTVSKV